MFHVIMSEQGNNLKKTKNKIKEKNKSNNNDNEKKEQ